MGLLGGLFAGFFCGRRRPQAQQQKCAYNIANGFARLASLESRATTQQQADAKWPGCLVRGRFSAKRLPIAFMENFETFAAPRYAPAANQEKLLRLAIAVIRQAPARSLRTKAPLRQNQVHADAVESPARPRMMSGRTTNRRLSQLPGCGGRDQQAEKVDTPPRRLVTPPPVTNGAVQMIRVPTQPLPSGP